MSEHTPLTQAAADGHIVTVRNLIEKGADINEYNGSDTALTWAAYNGHMDVVVYLVENGADLHITNAHGASPWRLAAKQGHADVAAFLEKAELKEVADKPPSKEWQRLNTEEIELTRSSGKTSLKHIFNFHTRERIVLYKDSAATPQPFDQIDQGYLREAYNEFTQQGGKADEAFVFKGARGVKNAQI